MTKCTLPKVLSVDVEITCVLDEPLHDYIEIEHQVIRDGFNEILTFTAIRSEEKLHWGLEPIETSLPSDEPNPSMEDVEEKMHANITFRQVSGFQFNKEEYFITFNFFGLTSVHLDINYYFIMDLHLIFKDGEMDTSASHAKLSLNNTVIYKVEESDKINRNH